MMAARSDGDAGKESGSDPCLQTVGHSTDGGQLYFANKEIYG